MKLQNLAKLGTWLLVDKVKHTFTQLSQWQMSLEKEPGKQAKTSDDMLVSHYTMVAGKQFK